MPTRRLPEKAIDEFFVAINRHRAECSAREIERADAARARAYRTNWIRKSENHRLERVLEMAAR